MENRAGELSSSVEIARDQIDDAFAEYKDLLEVRRIELHKELDTVHSEHEAQLSTTVSNYERTSQKIADACK